MSHANSAISRHVSLPHVFLVPKQIRFYKCGDQGLQGPLRAWRATLFHAIAYCRIFFPLPQFPPVLTGLKIKSQNPPFGIRTK
jgi:hypothetical protein